MGDAEQRAGGRKASRIRIRVIERHIGHEKGRSKTTRKGVGADIALGPRFGEVAAVLSGKTTKIMLCCSALQIVEQII